MHLAIIIPAHNEANVLGQVLHSLPKKLPKITQITPIVVNDNSTDQTAKIAKQAGAVCISHRINLGAGGATLTGFEAAKKLKADIIVTMDADGQHDASDIPALIQPIAEKRADVVLGSRLLKGKNDMPRYKVVGNNLLNAVTFMIFGIWVSDSQSGFKAFSQQAIRRIKIATSGYEFCSEIIGEIKRNKLRYIEIPITTIYTPYSKSKGQLSLNAINIVFGLLLRGLRQ